MSTVGEAVKMMNDEHLHPAGFHLFYVRDDLIAEHSGDAPHHLMSQTYDWRYEGPDKESYTVTLSADDMKYIGNAMEVYQTAYFTRHLAPALKRMIEKLGDPEKEKEHESYIKES